MDIKYNIVKEVGTITKDDKTWKKELNIISWNGGTPKYDLRLWSSDHKQMGKGITLSREELITLKDCIERELNN